MAQQADKEQAGRDQDRGGDDSTNNQQVIGSELAKAFEELAKGEKTASALENRLDDIESRIDQLLKSVEQSTEHAPSAVIANATSNDSSSKGD